MNKEINLVEILKNCEKGTKLYSTTYGEVTFEKIIKTDLEINYPIHVKDVDGYPITITSYGKFSKEYDGECILFPSKTNRNWYTFNPFKDGDILTDGVSTLIHNGKISHLRAYCGYCIVKNNTFYLPTADGDWITGKLRRATTDEIIVFFKVMNDAGYFWNNETKTIDNLVKDFNNGDLVMGSQIGETWSLFEYYNNNKVYVGPKSNNNHMTLKYIIPLSEFNYFPPFVKNIKNARKL